MTKVCLFVFSAIGIGGLCLPVPLAAQAQSTSGRPASAKPAAKAGWTVPRTPWGDPDLQGNYTNVYENGTPFEPRMRRLGARPSNAEAGSWERVPVTPTRS
jgi:hypothetical protein